MDLRKSAVIRHQDRPGIDKSLSASEVIGQIGAVMWRVLNYTTRERAIPRQSQAASRPMISLSSSTPLTMAVFALFDPRHSLESSSSSADNFPWTSITFRDLASSTQRPSSTLSSSLTRALSGLVFSPRFRERVFALCWSITRLHSVI